jgi:hypothetical protein
MEVCVAAIDYTFHVGRSDDRLEMEVNMQKSMGLRNSDLQKRAHLVAHLKRVSVIRESSAVRRPFRRCEDERKCPDRAHGAGRYLSEEMTIDGVLRHPNLSFR